MSTEDPITKLGERTDRSRFLRCAAVATAGVTAAMLGFASDAHALYYIKCCELCRQPGCGSTGNCNGSCTNVFCSTYQDWGTCLGRAASNERLAVPVP